LERILETATWAPSAHHRQHWRFAVLTSAEAKQRLADEMGADFRRDLQASGVEEAEIKARVERSRRRIMNAPVAIVLCMHRSVGDEYSDEKCQRAEYLMGVQSTALAGLQLLLATHGEGLGGVWTCGPLFAPDPVRRALNLSGEWEPQALILLGFPAEHPEPRPRRPIDEVVRYF
jgi:F420 biosynthesis protein FbiB-like protein